MENPFEIILNKLTAIEKLLFEIKESKNSHEIHRASYPDFLNITQASEYLHVAKQTIYGFTSSRNIPHYKTGKRIYFKREELDTWVIQDKVATV